MNDKPGSKHTEPAIEGFERVIETIACDSRLPPQSRDWVRDNFQTVADKVRVVRYILRNSPPENRRLLDVGAQIGAFAIFAAQAGCRVCAVDYDYYAGLYGTIAAEHGVDYRECDVGSQTLPFADHSFDFVTYMDVIEHHAFSPKRVLGEIHRVLAPGGCLLVTTPNHASLYNRILLLLGKSVNDDFESFFNQIEDFRIYTGHHREYTRAELKHALEWSGFHVKECRAVEGDLGSLRYCARRGKQTGQNARSHARAYLVRSLGIAWETLRLPFGRVIWAVGRKQEG